MEIFWLYLILQLNSISSVLVGFSIACTLTAILLTIVFVNPDSSGFNTWAKKYFISFFILASLGFVVDAMLPTTKSATILAGAYAVKEAARTETAQRLASKSVKLIEDWLTSLEPTKKETK